MKRRLIFILLSALVSIFGAVACGGGEEQQGGGQQQEELEQRVEQLEQEVEDQQAEIESIKVSEREDPDGNLRQGPDEELFEEGTQNVEGGQ